MVSYQETLLDNGLTVITGTDPAATVSDLALVVRAGYRYERPDEAGHAHFLEHMLMKGTKSFPSPTLLANRVEQFGGYRNAHTWMDRVWYDVQIAAEHTPIMIGLLADIMLNSLLEPSRIETEKGPIIQELKRAIAEPARYSERRAREEFYGAHPLGRTILKTEATTQSADRQQLLAHMERLYGSDRCALIVVGPLSHDDVVAYAEENFAAFRRARGPFTDKVEWVLPTARRVHENRDLPQTFISVWYPGPNAGEFRTLAALDLLQTWLSVGSTSVLMRELRHDRSLVYWQSLETETYDDAGSIQFSTASEKPAEALNVARDVLENAVTRFPAGELEAVRTKAVGGFTRRLAGGSNRLGLLVRMFTTYNQIVEPDTVLAAMKVVTYDDIVQAARYFRPEHAVVYTLGPDRP